MLWHTQNLSYDRLPTWRHGRGWFGPLHIEWNVFRDTHLFTTGVWLTGFNIYLRWFSLFVNVGDTERQRGRWSVSWSDGVLRISHPWERRNEWRSRDPWWKKSISLPVVDWLIGEGVCETIDGETLEVVVPMPEGSYRAFAKHQTRIWKRRWYWPDRRRDDVWLDIENGIPFAGKGENSWDCGDDGLFGTGGDTVEGAIANAVKSVLTARRKYGYDSAGTGQTPIMNNHDV